MKSEKRANETPADASGSPARDLCSTCRHAGDCIYLVERSRPIHQCEMFDVESGPLRAHPATDSAGQVRQGGASKEKFLGLCSNCDLRMTCKLPRPEGGVWHCEEYE